MATPENVSVKTVDVSNIISQELPDAAAAAAAGPGSPEQLALDAAKAAAPKPKLDAEGNPVLDADGNPVMEAPAPAKKEEAADADAALSLDKADPKPVEVDSTGHDEFDVVGKMLGEKGVENVNEIMEHFLDNGEFSLEHKAQMIEALGEGVASMAFKQMEGAAEAMIAEAKEDTRKSMDYANTKFGGEDAALTWSQIQEYVHTKEAGFSEAELAAMNTMLEAGGLQAELVIDRVHKVYTADSNVSLPGTLLEGDTGVSGGAFEPISRIDYSAAMSKAVGKYGEDSSQVRDLNRRRELTMSRGL